MMYAAAAPVRSATYDLVRGLVTERERYESSLPFTIVHGDYGTDNVLMCGGTVVAILDFDFMAYRERVFELAYALYWTLDRLHVPAEGAPYSDSALKRAAGLLRRYATTATPLTDGEIEVLPFEMARVPLYPIVEAGYTTDAPYTSGPLAQTLAFARHVPVARWLVSEAVQVRRTLAT
jgi:homoserine kinase type II